MTHLGSGIRSEGTSTDSTLLSYPAVMVNTRTNLVKLREANRETKWIVKGRRPTSDHVCGRHHTYMIHGDRGPLAAHAEKC